MLDIIQNILGIKQKDVANWFEAQWKNLRPNIYLSCDIRHSGFKIGVVDSNLFPAGFNNLCTAFSRQTALAFKCYLEDYFPHVKKIVLLAEDHTRNKFYLLNLLHLKKLLSSDIHEIEFAIIGNDIGNNTLEVSVDEGKLTLFKLSREKNLVRAGNFVPDLILSNNDFSTGIPEILKGLDQSIIPHPALGWHQRRKSRHFSLLKEITDSFCKEFNLDPWMINAFFDVSAPLDFNDANSINKLATQVDALISKIGDKYNQYQIKEVPYVYIKNNTGTYGMGLAAVFSGEDILLFNRKKKNKLMSAKGGMTASNYLLQEGIPTIDKYSGFPVEPVIYAVGAHDVGGFFRVHESKNEFESLNAPGMSFSCLCLHKLDEPHESYFLDCQEKEHVVNVSRFLCRLAALASARELELVK